jgi:hypothetical protein
VGAFAKRRFRRTILASPQSRNCPRLWPLSNLGHASLGTTTIYVTTEQKRRMKATRVHGRRGG